MHDPDPEMIAILKMSYETNIAFVFGCLLKVLIQEQSVIKISFISSEQILSQINFSWNIAFWTGIIKNSCDIQIPRSNDEYLSITRHQHIHWTLSTWTSVTHSATTLTLPPIVHPVQIFALTSYFLIQILFQQLQPHQLKCLLSVLPLFFSNQIGANKWYY